MAERFCPDCRIAMKPETLHNVHIDGCPRCAGVWFDDGELGTLQQRGLLSEVEDLVVPSMERAPKKTARFCPVCPDVLLDEYAYMYSSPVKIDACPTCYGIWVQDGELRAMEHLAIQAHNQPVTSGIEHRLAAVQMEAEHEENMSRHRMFQRVMRVFSSRRPSIFR